MGKRYKFRKVYFICEDNNVFGGTRESVECYRREDYCQRKTMHRRKLAFEDAKIMWATGLPMKHITMHSFYLVHETLYDEILKDHTK